MFVYVRKMYPFLIAAVIIAGLILFSRNFNTPFQQFSLQSQSFLQGRLDIPPQSIDTVLVNGKHYWPQGPFPSLVIMPFQFILGSSINQSHIQLLLLAVLALLLFKLAKLKHYHAIDSLYFVIAFFFGSTAIGLATDPRSWYFAQMVALVVLTALILELNTKKRPLVMGLLGGFLIATRLTSGMITVFIFYTLLENKSKSYKQKILKISLFTLPIVISIVALMVFNQIRFNNPFDTGYGINRINPVQEPLRRESIFSLSHFYDNFFHYFLRMPELVIDKQEELIFPYLTYNPWGLSFFLVSPFFLYSLKTLKNKSFKIRGLWLVVLLILVILLFYYAPGWTQYGPRYTADFLPILYFLTLESLSKYGLDDKKRGLIIASSLFNLYLLYFPFHS